MPAAVAVPILQAAIPAVASIGGSVLSSKSQSGANKRALAASSSAAAKAEAFERERAAKQDADEVRLEAEERRRWDVEQQNIAAERAERDQRQRMMDQRQQYDDQIRYRKRVNLARLTGSQAPEAPPMFGLPSDGTYTPLASTYSAPGAPILARPSTANAMVAAPGQFDPFADTQMPGIALNSLGRRRMT